jgi:nitroreductase
VESDTDTLTEALKALDAPTRAYEPALFELHRPDDRTCLLELMNRLGTRVRQHDSVTEQVAQLLAVQNPKAKVSVEEARDHVHRHGGEAFGVWVHYPWLDLLVRTLPKAEFRQLRAARNRYKITPSEQARLLGARVGIVGLSAGYSIAVCMALEGVGGSLRLADFDTVELSNTNRIACGLPGLGTNKAVLAARRLYEVDPFLSVEVFDRGISEDNLDAFVDGGGRLDLLVDECDDLWLKVRLREEARRHRIPVLMETNDRGLLDIERFDLEPGRPIFHGLVGDVTSAELRGLSLEAKTPFVLQVVGEKLSSRARASLLEINPALTGWPQLGSGTMLGGAVATDTARRMLLGQLRQSGRYYVDLEAIVSDRTASSPHGIEPTLASEPTQHTDRAASRSPRGEPAPGEIRGLVARAITAPSGGNAQPWYFVWHDGRLDCFLDRARAGSTLDFEYASSYVALGATAEALQHAATAAGREAEFAAFPSADTPDLVYRAGIGPRSSVLAASSLGHLLEARCTNRRLGPRVPLAATHQSALVEAALECQVELRLVTEPDALHELGAVLGEVDRFRFLTERLHAELMSELRFTDEQARATRDGIDLATLEVDAGGLAALELLRDPSACALLRQLDRGAALAIPARRSIDAASAVGLLTVKGTGPIAYLRGGHAVERVWLVATSLGLAFQPLAVAPYLFAKLERGADNAFTPSEREALGRLRRRFSSVFPVRSGHAEPLLFRIAHAEPPRVRSLRRPIDDVLFWE